LVEDLTVSLLYHIIASDVSKFDRKAGNAMEELLTSDEILAELKISRSTLYRLLATQQLTAYQIGKNGSALRFKRGDVQSLLRQRQASPVAQHPMLPMKYG
jgi:excisionase family DNA binding protein